ncbi:MAG: hypothetical protein M5R40_25400 [Anaerolineae bacterium]|nr:hypothetical protein [Anaerolineae bacterium]
MGTEVLQSASAVVGSGLNSIRAARASGVQVAGEIVDAETGAGIPGALFILLRPEYSVEDFTWDSAQVLATSVADQEGYFEIPVRLPLDGILQCGDPRAGLPARQCGRDPCRCDHARPAVHAPGDEQRLNLSPALKAAPGGALDGDAGIQERHRWGDR